MIWRFLETMEPMQGDKLRQFWQRAERMFSGAFVLRYGIAVVLTAIYIPARLKFAGLSSIPFVPLVGIIALCAGIGGLAGGLFATAVTSAGYMYASFILSSHPVPARINLIGFVIVSVIVNLLAEALRRSQSKVEQALESSQKAEQELSDFFQNAVVGMHWVAGDGTIVRANVAQLKLLGYSEDEYVGHNIAEFHAVETVEEIMQRLNSPEKVQNHSAKLKAKDGQIKEVLIDSSPLWEGGKFVHSRCFIRDVTETNKINSQFQRNQERLEIAQGAGKIGTFEWDVVTNKVYGSKEFETLLGFTDGEFGGNYHNWIQSIYSRDRGPFEDSLNGTLSSGKYLEAQFRTVWPDGSRHWLAARGKVFYDEVGNPLRMVGIHIDITAAKQAEANQTFLLRASKLLTSSLNYQTTLTSIAHLAIEQMADWCRIDMINEDGQLQRLAVVHSDPKMVDQAIELDRHAPIDNDSDHPIARVIRERRSILLKNTSETTWQIAPRDSDYLNDLLQSNLSSAMIVPIVANQKGIGAISFMLDRPRIYSESDLAIAESLADRVAAAVENTRLYNETKQARDEFEERVEQRTSELTQANNDLSQLAAIVNSSDDAIISKDLSGIITSWNHGAELMYGYRADEVIGRPITILAPPGMDDDIPQIMDQLKEGTAVERYETKRMRRDGKIMHVSLTVSPIRSADGEIIGGSTIARDITQRKQAEQALVDSQVAMEEAQAIAHIGSWEWDLVSNELIWSKELYRIHGLNPDVDNISNDRIRSFNHPSDQPTVNRVMDQAKQTGEPFEFDYRIIKPDGTFSILHAEGHGTKNAEGKVIRLNGTDQDVTEQRLSEEIIRHSEERFRALAENAQDAIVSTNSKGSITYFNRAAEELFGYAESEVFGKSIKTLFLDKFNMAADENLADYLAQHELKLIGRQTEITGKTKSGQELSLELSLAKWQSSQDTFFTAIIRDISERKKVEQMKSDFISMVSHQLKTPLAIIRGYADNILLGITGPLSERQREYVGEMRDISDRYYALIARLLSVARMERGTVPIEKHPTELGRMIDRVVSNHRQRLEQKELKLDLGGMEEPIIVDADAEKTIEAISNILDNAIKFTPQGGTISFLAGSDGVQGWMEINDNGPGIPPETLPKMFKRDQMFSGAPSAEGGTGLGLYIAKELMTLQNGDISVESQLGMGTKFTFTLPLAKVGIESGVHE